MIVRGPHAVSVNGNTRIMSASRIPQRRGQGLYSRSVPRGVFRCVAFVQATMCSPLLSAPLFRVSLFMNHQSFATQPRIQRTPPILTASRCRGPSLPGSMRMTPCMTLPGFPPTTLGSVSDVLFVSPPAPPASRLVSHHVPVLCHRSDWRLNWQTRFC